MHWRSFSFAKSLASSTMVEIQSMDAMKFGWCNPGKVKEKRFYFEIH